MFCNKSLFLIFLICLLRLFKVFVICGDFSFFLGFLNLFRVDVIRFFMLNLNLYMGLLFFELEFKILIIVKKIKYIIFIMYKI